MSSRLCGVSLLIVRENSNGKRDILVRYSPLSRYPVYTILSERLERGETALDCARRIGQVSLGITFTQHDLDLEASALASQTGERDQTRVFLVPSNAEFEALVQRDDVGGWKYAFVPISSLHSIYIGPGVEASKDALFALASMRGRGSR
ncbi:hypothetical protein F4678DRAFT_485021 [Xylaria arbuscula]|nr:hypothetical protein F4678DRAFT_485021 [Xylaria arbuscula]